MQRPGATDARGGMQGGQAPTQVATSSLAAGRNCGTGWYFISGNCRPCRPGTYWIKDDTCADCPPGTFAPGQASLACSVCPKGTFQDGTDTLNDYCKGCEAGKYSAITGATRSSVCTDCPAGTASNSDNSPTMITRRPSGSEMCTACRAGTYASKAATGFCTPCAAGKFSTALAAISPGTCANCPAGTWTCNEMMCVTAGCFPCQSGTFSTKSGGVGSCQNCAAGKYSRLFPEGPWRTLLTACTDCSPGEVSAEGAGQCTPCKAGTYAAQKGLAACSACPAGKESGAGAASCTDLCPGMTDQSVMSGRFDGMCMLKMWRAAGCTETYPMFNEDSGTVRACGWGGGLGGLAHRCRSSAAAAPQQRCDGGCTGRLRGGRAWFLV
jgi:hypothetical protein